MFFVSLTVIKQQQQNRRYKGQKEKKIKEMSLQKNNEIQRKERKKGIKKLHNKIKHRSRATSELMNKSK